MPDGQDATRHPSVRPKGLSPVARLDPETGHQTQIITTIAHLSALEVAKAMFSRWRQENFFRSMGPRYGLDALDSYAKVPDDASRTVPNPAKAKARAKVAAARSSIAAAESAEGRASLDGGRSVTDQEKLAHAFAVARAELARLQTEAKAVPARVRLGELHPDAVAFCPERKRIHDPIRMATRTSSSVARQATAPTSGGMSCAVSLGVSMTSSRAASPDGDCRIRSLGPAGSPRADPIVRS